MAGIQTDAGLIREALERSVERIYPSREALEAALLSGRRLRIYHGVDPTGPHLHFGHLTNLLALRRFQALGHEIIFLIGDFTARIGDPTDKLAVRKPLTDAEVWANLATFRKQASRVLRFAGENPARIRFNSKWLATMKLADFLGLAGRLTTAQMLERDMFQERMREGKPIHLNEFLYPLLQGYDSVAMDVDMELGGTDQTFNMLIGRDLVKSLKNKEKFVVTTKLLEHPATGKKLMNKSEGGLINLDDAPGDIFGGVMALDDESVLPVAELSTKLPMEDVEKLKVFIREKPRDAKLKIAAAAVEAVYSRSAAVRARREFAKVFQEKQKPDDIPQMRVGAAEMPLADILVAAKLAPSKSEARRLIEQGAVRIDDERKNDPNETISLDKERLLQVGPRRFVKVVA